MLEDLSGKRALVTGSSSGIGAAVAKALARHGTSVVIHGFRNAGAAKRIAEEITTEGGNAVVVLGDVSRSEVCSTIVEESAQALGGLDILVNNAGSIIQRVTNAAFDDNIFRRVFDLNVRSVLAVTSAAYPYLKASGHGVIINTGSVAGRMGGYAGSAAYAAAKAAVHTITRNAAREFAADGIRVNTVAPGYVETPIHSATPQRTRQRIASEILMQRAGTVDECTGAYVFLASASMSSYITGQIVDVNGGLHIG